MAIITICQYLLHDINDIDLSFAAQIMPKKECALTIFEILTLTSAVTIFYRKIEIEFFPKIEARIEWRSCLIKPSILVHGASEDRGDQRRPSNKTEHMLTATVGCRMRRLLARPDSN